MNHIHTGVVKRVAQNTVWKTIRERKNSNKKSYTEVKYIHTFVAKLSLLNRYAR